MILRAVDGGQTPDDSLGESFQDLKIEFARKFHAHYSKTIVTILCFVILKRISFNGGYVTIAELFVHIGTLLLFYILSLLYGTSRQMTKYMPYIYALISYYSHTIFIFKGLFD